ncbi:MAG: CBS domain-containing protein, partial [Rhodospirillales bacterium]|nr:CBS domain-containing protein [Rhodospirillales bacterium]
MTDPALHGEGQDAEATEEAVYGLDSEFEERFVDALDAGDLKAVRVFLEDLHTADTADLLERLKPDHRSDVIKVLREDFDPDILPELDDEVRDDVIDELGVEETAAAIAELDSDDAVEVIEELDEEEQQELLEAIPAGDRALIEEALAYPEDSAGRLMQREVVTVPEFWTVGEAIDFMRGTADREDGDESLPEVFYDIYVIDPARRPVGTVSLSRLMRTRRPVPVTDIMEPDMKQIPAITDQEEVAFLFMQRDLVSAP